MPRLTASSTSIAAAHEGVPPWEGCCVTHDRAYHAGGADPDPEASYAARIAADEELRRQVKNDTVASCSVRGTAGW